MNNKMRIYAAVLLLHVLGTQATGQQDLQAQAEMALTNGEPEQTIALAQSVLAEDAENYAALFLTAVAQSDLGQYAQAAATARQAYRVAQTPAERLQAARLAASTRFRTGQYTAAEWWLRRAANNAETDEDVATVRQEFRNIRQKNPLSVRFNFSVAPSNNINNGSEDEFFRLEGLDIDFQLPPSQLALSGTEYVGDVQLSYRVSQGIKQVTDVGALIYGRTFTLSPDAQDTVPDLSGGDFALALAEISVNHRRLLLSGLGPTSISLHSGKTRYGRAPLYDYKKITLGQAFSAGENGVLNLEGAVQGQTSQNPIQRDTMVYDLAGVFVTNRSNQDQLRLSLTAQLNDTGDIESTFRDYQASFGYGPAKPFLGTEWAFSFGVGHTTYKEFSLSLTGRRDTYAILGTTATFADISYFGFSPSLSVSAKRTVSDVSQFTSSQLSVRAGIQSSF